MLEENWRLIWLECVAYDFKTEELCGRLEVAVSRFPIRSRNEAMDKAAKGWKLSHGSSKLLFVVQLAPELNAWAAGPMDDAGRFDMTLVALDATMVDDLLNQSARVRDMKAEAQRAYAARNAA